MARRVPDAPVTAPPTPGRDSRVEKLARNICQAMGGQVYEYRTQAELSIKNAERAGLLVLDPSSPELVERIARGIFGGTDSQWETVVGRGEKESLRKAARAVLAALASPGGGK